MTASAGADQEMSSLAEQAFVELYKQARRPLRSYVYRGRRRRADADDIVQEAFYRLWRADLSTLSSTDARRYLFGVANHLVTDRWRREEREKRWRRRVEPPRAIEEPVWRDDVTKTFAQLKPQDRALLWLAHVEEQSHADVARALGLRRARVKGLLFRARGRLRELLNALNER